jgi:hypothetical protein
MTRVYTAIALCVTAGLLAGVSAVAAQQERGPSASDLLVAGRSVEQPQPSAYPLDVPGDQVQAMGPTAEYDPLYSTTKLTGQQLVATIYADLKRSVARPAARSAAR